MKRKLLACFFALFMLFALTTVSMANPKVFLTEGPGTTIGGIFNVYEDAVVPPYTFLFQSFCLELNEGISMGTPYTYSIDTAAVAGGYGGGSPDPLDAKTAYLYYSFITGTLADFSIANVADVDGLQYAIWYIENEINALPVGKATTYYDAAVAAGWTDINGVRVFNLYDGQINKQSLLIYVPEPLSLILFGLGLLGLGITRRIKK